jgi:hypothetical protein
LDEIAGGGVFSDIPEPGGVEPLEADDTGRRTLIDEYGDDPRDAEVFAYRTTPTSLWPASIATARAVSPSLSFA